MPAAAGCFDAAPAISGGALAVELNGGTGVTDGACQGGRTAHDVDTVVKGAVHVVKFGAPVAERAAAVEDGVAVELQLVDGVAACSEEIEAAVGRTPALQADVETLVERVCKTCGSLVGYPAGGDGADALRDMA